MAILFPCLANILKPKKSQNTRRILTPAALAAVTLQTLSAVLAGRSGKKQEKSRETVGQYEQRDDWPNEKKQLLRSLVSSSAAISTRKFLLCHDDDVLLFFTILSRFR